MREEAVLGDTIQNVLGIHSLSGDELRHEPDTEKQRQRNIMYILNRLQKDGTTLPPCDVQRELKSFRVDAEKNLAKMGTTAVPSVIMQGLGGKRKREMTDMISHVTSKEMESSCCFFCSASISAVSKKTP